MFGVRIEIVTVVRGASSQRHRLAASWTGQLIVYAKPSRAPRPDLNAIRLQKCVEKWTSGGRQCVFWWRAAVPVGSTKSGAVFVQLSFLILEQMNLRTVTVRHELSLGTVPLRSQLRRIAIEFCRDIFASR